MSQVTAIVEAERISEIVETYRAGLAPGLPPTVEASFLLIGEDGVVMIATVWRDREDMQATIARGEPLAGQLLREAGGNPEVRVLDVRLSAQQPSSVIAL